MREQKITLGQMRRSGVTGLLIFCSDYRCSHHIAISSAYICSETLTCTTTHSALTNWPTRATARMLARWSDMISEQQNASNCDQTYSASQLKQLMSEVISLREKVAQAELERNRYGAATEKREASGRVRH